jgi:hypothetical protein
MSAAKRDPRNALIEALAAALRDCRDYLECIPEAAAGGDDEAGRLTRLANAALTAAGRRDHPPALSAADADPYVQDAIARSFAVARESGKAALDAYSPVAGRCNVCGTDTRHDAGRCTNGRCGACHRACCTPGGETSPGHGLGSPEVIAARRAALTATGFRDYDATTTATTEPKL